ncbi:3-isopropylmalate dehydratase small subunit 1 [Candidatus Annandia adelgestsuga]|uniref:3-isopropylmalate dehydratase small subunit n=1 Tax=Candidatus Annandia adelgestsuga TaxID=1302411 RepID=A0A3Q9CP50_9ENTR|nr:3-isopropylmalate dehydratase small subunit [Candidatus Annandia adelgestsuga]AZP36245.1 3-isopropylmalate dehydratase small subunit 1 [Candidatus Annandia adelgestsuga]
MKKLLKHKGIVLPLDISNVDTDVIIPKQFLQIVNRNGLGKYLFYNWRFLKDDINKLNYNFVINKIEFKNSSILLTRNNFGCGSSREHAVWSLLDFGFKVIISTSFADIFYNNALNNHLIPIVLKEKIIKKLFVLVYKNPGIKFTINLQKCLIIINKFNLKYSFSINKFQLYNLINKLDHINLTMKYEKKIKDYENKQLKYIF